MYTYLTMSLGPRAGTSYLLNPLAENRIGRGTDCLVVLTDPRCSRVHSIVTRRDNRWHVRDAGSRNGTFVNDQKVDEAVLAEGHHLRVGSTEFSFHQSSEPPTAQVDGIGLSQTIIRETRYGTPDSALLPMALIESEQAQDLLLLYQLSFKLLAYTSSNDVLRVSLDLLRDRTGASLVGFLWVTDEGTLKPKMVIPERAAGQVVLSESLTQHVLSEGHAVWIANQSGGAHDHLESYADALCVPMLSSEGVLGALHVYLDRGRFRQSHFDFAISLANMTSVALVRARRDESLVVDLARLKAKSSGADELVGDSPPIADLKTKIARLGRATGCVLIRGESGTGKELVARALHRASNRADRPMLSVNCAAIPADLMESQLFGHRAGSFTGADRDHVGYFQQADLGTLFLDEVGELTLAGQAKLLRILEGHPFLPVGAATEVQVDVRVIAATNRDLLSYVRERKFREDLFYRLSVFELYVPPLRERGKDIGLLIDFFLDRFLVAHGRPNLKFSKTARDKLLGYSWPGNVRQLRNVIDSAVVLAAGDEILPEDLGLRDTGETELMSLRLEDWERKLIAEALRRSDGNVPEAARLLGIGRATLYRKIEEYGIER